VEILLRGFALESIVLLVMYLAALVDGGEIAIRRGPAVKTWLNVLTGFCAWGCLLGLVVASVSQRLQQQAGGTALLCGLVATGVALARLGPVRGLGYLLLGIAALLATGIVATWLGWQGVNLHMN